MDVNDGALGRNLNKDKASGCFTAVTGGERSSICLLLMGVEFLRDPKKQNFLRLSGENSGLYLHGFKTLVFQGLISV